MENNSKKAGVNRYHDQSIIEKTAFATGHLIIVLICFWLIFFDGLTKSGSLFGYNLSFSDIQRAYILFTCAFIYWVRHFITLFYLLARKVEWSEVTGLLVFIALIDIGLVLTGGGVFRDFPIKLNWLDFFAAILLLSGSYLNSYSEIQRKIWKKDPKNKGKCYTKGLFRFSMHINYFGDTVLFTGWCLFTNNLWTLALPLLMAVMFIFYHIPGLDLYLAGRYGKDFERYSEKTKKFIPFIY